ncbi:MAG: adenylyltransferase/cytidyltransferase family protein [Desulfovibrio sp.]|nr:adenylyltransferase/cytidyltransferase family protein [Desulfovibrio sp.]
MITVITYGTFDLLHEGHINILRRAKNLGDKLIVGVTSDDYDRYRGKLNVRQSLAERISAVKDTGYADKIIIEEYDGQKIEDIRKYGVDIITLGSDWTGRLDFLKKYCRVIYLPRTENISSTQLRTGGRTYNVGILCDRPYAEHDLDELKFVAGIDFNVVFAAHGMANVLADKRSLQDCSDDFETFCRHCDIVYADWRGSNAFSLLQSCVQHGKHVLSPHCCGCTSQELQTLEGQAKASGVLMRLIPPSGSLSSYTQMKNIAMSGTIGQILRVEVSYSFVGTSKNVATLLRCAGSTCCLPVLDLLGDDCREKANVVFSADAGALVSSELRTREGFAGIRISNGPPVEARMFIQGTEGYIKVPTPWWDMDYFEVHADAGHARKYSWPANGRAIRYQLGDFVRCVSEKRDTDMHEDIRLAAFAEHVFHEELHYAQ